MIERLRAWWTLACVAWWQWREPKDPIVTIEWRRREELSERTGKLLMCDCGHLSRSYAWNPVGNQWICIECYRRTTGKRHAR
jgi:hypothetical protein